jgi:hypothetical protein
MTEKDRDALIRTLLHRARCLLVSAAGRPLAPDRRAELDQLLEDINAVPCRTGAETIH